MIWWGTFFNKIENQPHFCCMYKKVHPIPHQANFFCSHYPNGHIPVHSLVSNQNGSSVVYFKFRVRLFVSSAATFLTFIPSSL